MLLTGLFLIAAMAILVMKGREEQVQLQKRYEELLMDYPGLIMKFTLLVQAGMTVRKAFQKILWIMEERESGIQDLRMKRYGLSAMRWKAEFLKVKHTERFGEKMWSGKV